MAATDDITTADSGAATMEPAAVERAAFDPDDPDDLLLWVPAEADGERLDKFLSRAVAGLSRGRIQFLILGGHVAIDGVPPQSVSRKVRQGAAVTVVFPPPATAFPEPEDIPLDIVHEDSDLLVINKPPGLVVHPARGHESGTLVNALLHHCGERLSGIKEVRRPGIVHRLDKDTSGLMVVAKTNRAHNALAHQLHDRSLSRTYSALVWDRPNPAEGTIEGAIGRHPTHRKKMAVVEQGGKAARTRYTTERSYGPADAPPLVSLVECHLETGRTHQIRVHMADIGHPLIGDPLYGRQRNPTNRRDLPAVSKQAVATLAAFPRQALHAKQICFAHPADGAQMCFFAPHPADFARLLSTLE